METELYEMSNAAPAPDPALDYWYDEKAKIDYYIDQWTGGEFTQQQYEAGIEQLVSKVFEIPHVEEAVTAEAEKQITTKWGGAGVFLIVAGIGAAFAVGRASS